MTINQLRAFAVTAEHLHFTEAAKAIHVAGPSMSSRITALEADLQTRLFLRNHQEVFFTAQGAALLPYVQEIVNRVDDLPNIVRRAEEEQPAQLRIGLDPTEVRTDVPFRNRLFDMFRFQHPGVALNVTNLTSDCCENGLLNGTLDMAIAILPGNTGPDDRFFHCELQREDVDLLAADAGEEGVEYLLHKRKLVLLEDQDRRFRWNEVYMDCARRIYPKADPVLLPTVPSLCWSILNEGAVAFLPHSYVDCLSHPAIRAFPMHSKNMTVSVTALWGRCSRNPAVAAFLETAKAMLAGAKKSEDR